MKRCCKRSVAAVAALLVATAATAAAVRAWRRERDSSFEDPFPASVPDTVLADRVRSELGTVERELDVPHVHVMVEHDVVVLHGDVPTDAAARRIVERVRAVRGVRDVVSRLHVGLLPSDTRPSAGSDERSEAARRLVRAARSGGGGEHTGELAARAVLEAFATAIPLATRRRVTSHLPVDVALWLAPTHGLLGLETVDDLYAAVSARDAFPRDHAPWVVAGVLGELRALVPGEADAVAAALPPDLRHLWDDVAEAS